MMKKVSQVFLRIFGVGITLCLFAGGAALLGFLVAMIIGGENATKLCVFIHKTYFPWVIRFTSVLALCGLVGMYLSKIRALTVTTKVNNGGEEQETAPAAEKTN